MTDGKRNLIYGAVFINPDFVNLLDLQLQSMKLYGQYNPDTTDLMMMTDETLQPKLAEVAAKSGFTFKYYYLKIDHKWQSSAARLEIFKWSEIESYDTILYIDTDILVHKNINTLFNLPLRNDKIYAIGEGRIADCWWGGEFFDYKGKPYDECTEAFCAGILMFKNAKPMKDLFQQINDHIYDYVFVQKKNPEWWEQPFIVYNAVSENKYDNQLLKRFVVNNKFHISQDDLILYHFPVGPGWYSIKYENMKNLSVLQNEFYHSDVLPKLVGSGFRTAKDWISVIKPDRLAPLRFLEVGVFCGHNMVMFERTYGRHPDTRLYGIDVWDMPNSEYTEKWNQIENYKSCLQNVCNTGRAEKFELRKGFSHLEIGKFPDDFFDFIYLDGNHNTENVVEDGVLAFRKLKSGGYLIFDDYDWESVKKGVDYFTSAYAPKFYWIAIANGQNFFKKR